MAQFGLRSLFRSPAAIPQAFEKSLPAGLPSISSLMVAAADALPDALPIPGSISGQTADIPVVEFVKGIEAALPAGVPKLFSQTPTPGKPGPTPGRGARESGVKTTIF